MLRSLESLLGYRIAATNGDVGTVEDFLLVDDTWTVRYLVVAAGGWLDRKRVLLSTVLTEGVSDATREIAAALTRESVYASPDVDTDKPVTKQKEILLAEHYGWTPYATTAPFLGVDIPADRLEIDAELAGCNPHLRSFREIATYAVRGETPLGLASDMIIDDGSWQITGIVTAKGLTRSGDLVLVPPAWVRKVDWTHRAYVIDPHDPEMDQLPEFDYSAAANRITMVQHFDYYGRLHHSTPSAYSPTAPAAVKGKNS